jgi:hypothetical protein
MTSDYNARYPSLDCRTNNSDGMALYNFINLKSYKMPTPPGPTYWTTFLLKKPNILDLFVSITPGVANLFKQVSYI